MKASIKYERWLERLDSTDLLYEQEKLMKVKTLLIDFESRGTTSEDWEMVYSMEELVGLRMAYLEDKRWYDPVKQMFSGW